MLKLLAFGTAVAIACTAGIISREIISSSEAGTQSGYDSRLTEIHMPNTIFATTLPGAVRNIAAVIALNLFCSQVGSKGKAVKGLESNLLSRLNPDVADRLLKGVRRSNPERSEQWCMEKVICDLERDRR